MKSKVFEIFEQRCNDGINQGSLLIIRILSLVCYKKTEGKNIDGKNVERKRPKKIRRWKICRKIFVDDKNIEKLMLKKKY
jgi:hypothetical protein